MSLGHAWCCLAQDIFDIGSSIMHFLSGADVCISWRWDLVLGENVTMKTIKQRLMEALNKKAVMFGLPEKPIVVPESESEAS